MVKPRIGDNQREESHRKDARRELKSYWDRVLRNTASVIQQMTVPQLVRLVSDDIFAVKTGCDYLENHENTMDLHVNKLIRIVVEEKLHDYLRSEERILRDSAKVERKLDRLLRIREANRSILPLSSQASNRRGIAASNGSTKKWFSDCSIM
uniref:Imidazolonepropionase n=1 Tax=Lygus hesperus TaxID=30085 RepID=A0A0A9ZAY6_LYGHE